MVAGGHDGIPSEAVVEIGDGALCAGVAPGVGGALTRLAFDRGDGRWFDVLRPATARAVAGRSPREMACFAMVPFASRVHRGRFEFGGRSHQLAINMPEHEAALHGDGWQHPWALAERGPHRVVLNYRQDGTAFPFAYAASLEVAVERARSASSPWTLRMALEIRNAAAEPMPAGMGFHPFFTRSPDATLQFDAAAVWERDRHGRVTARRALDDPGDEARRSFVVERRIDGEPRNDIYEGWSGAARIQWPSAGVRAEIRSSPTMSRLLVFVPPERPVFCVEPISNLPDGINLLGSGVSDSPIAILGPGEALRGEMRLAVSPMEPASCPRR